MIYTIATNLFGHSHLRRTLFAHKCSVQQISHIALKQKIVREISKNAIWLPSLHEALLQLISIAKGARGANYMSMLGLCILIGILICI